MYLANARSLIHQQGNVFSTKRRKILFGLFSPGNDGTRIALGSDLQHTSKKYKKEKDFFHPVKIPIKMGERKKMRVTKVTSQV